MNFINIITSQLLGSVQLLVRVQRVDGDGAGVGELVQLQVLRRVDHHALLQLASQSDVSIAALDQSEASITWSSR